MRTSRISRISRRIEPNTVEGKLTSVTVAEPPTKEIGIRSPRCLGPSSPFAYLKDPDYMNILPLDANAGKFITIPVKNSAFGQKRRNVDATLDEISKDLEHITFLFQEITPQAPIRIDKKEETLEKQERLQLLESVLEWLKAASFDLTWAKTTIEEKDLDNSNDAVQSLLHDSIKSVDRLRAIHKQLMLQFKEYFRRSQTRDANVEEKLDSLSPSKSDPGINYRALSAEVSELLQRERSRTAEAYESKLNILNNTLEGQALLIKKLTDNLKNKNLYEPPKEKERDIKTYAEDYELQKSKKTTKQKKKPLGTAADDEGETSSAQHIKRQVDDDSKDKEMLSLQKTLRNCQLDTARLSQQNRVLVETKKELTTSNAHKDKVIGELRAKLLLSEVADKPTIDKKLVVEAPKKQIPPREKPEKPASAHSRFIYVDNADRGGSTSPSSQESPARPMMELFAQKKGPFRRVTDEDDTGESEEGPVAVKGRKSGIVKDSEMVPEGKKEKKEKQRFPRDSETVWKEEKGERGDDVFKDTEKTLDTDKAEKQAGARDLEKVSGERSAVARAGGSMVSGLDAEKVEKQSGSRDLEKVAGERSAVASAGGRIVSSHDADKVEKHAGTKDLEKAAGERSAVTSAGGSMVSGLDADKVEKHAGTKDLEKAAGERPAVTSAGVRLASGSDSQGAVEGKGRDGRGKGTGTSEGAGTGVAAASTASAVAVSAASAAASAREKVGGSGLGSDRQSKAAEDRTVGGKARESPRSRGSSGSIQEPFGGTDGAARKSSKRLVGAGGGKTSDDETLQAVGRRSYQASDSVTKLDRDVTKSDRVGGEVSFIDAKAQGRLSRRMIDQEPTEAMEGLRVKPMAGVEKEYEKQQKGSALSREPSPGGIVGSHVSERYGVEKGDLPELAVGISKSSKDQSQLRDRDQRVDIRRGTPDPDFGSGVGYSEGQSPLFGAVEWKGLPDVGANVGYLPSDRPGSIRQQAPGFKYNLGAFMPQHMGQSVGWLADEREGVVPFREEPWKGLHVTGATAMHSGRPGAEKELTGSFPPIQPLKDSAGMARVLRSYEVNLNDPNTFAQQLEFIKQSGTIDGLREAMKLLAPYLQLLGENGQKGENALMDVMRALQKRHAELITQEFQPATVHVAGVDATDARQRRLLTFVTDRRQDICRSRARQQLLLTQRQAQARGLVHLKPLLGQEANALSSCPPYLPVGYVETLPQKLMKESFPLHKGQRLQQVTSAREAKLRPGNQYLMVGLTIDSLLKTIDKLAKCGRASSG